MRVKIDGQYYQVTATKVEKGEGCEHRPAEFDGGICVTVFECNEEWGHDDEGVPPMYFKHPFDEQTPEQLDGFMVTVLAEELENQRAMGAFGYIVEGRPDPYDGDGSEESVLAYLDHLQDAIRLARTKAYLLDESVGHHHQQAGRWGPVKGESDLDFATMAEAGDEYCKLMLPIHQMADVADQHRAVLTLVAQGKLEVYEDHDDKGGLRVRLAKKAEVTTPA